MITNENKKRHIQTQKRANSGVIETRHIKKKQMLSGGKRWRKISTKSKKNRVCEEKYIERDNNYSGGMSVIHTFSKKNAHVQLYCTQVCNYQCRTLAGRYIIIFYAVEVIDIVLKYT